MSQAELAVSAPEADEENKVRAYLQENPEFFLRNESFLADLPLNHACGGAASLIERQVGVLRERNSSLQGRLDQLMETARANENRVNGLNVVAQSLISAEDLPAALAAIADSFREAFAVDEVTLALFDVEQDSVLMLAADEHPACLKDFFRQCRTLCGPFDEATRSLLFGEDTEVASAALVPLDRAQPLGLLALGSKDEQRFLPEMGNLFLDMTAALCTTALRSHGVGQS